MIIAKDLQPGTLIRYRDEPYIILNAKYIKPGNGAGYVDTKVQMVRDGRVLKKIFAPSVQLETVTKESKDAKLLSHNNGNSKFELIQSGKQVDASKKITGKKIHYIPVGTNVVLHYYDGELLEITFPKTVAHIVKHVVDGKAQLETGTAIKVPSFIKVGDTIIVNTSNGKFVYKKG